MLFRCLKVLFKIANRLYFRSYKIEGLENIPETGPVLLTANHPSAFMDPIVIASLTKRPVYFLARSVYFQNGFIKWLFSKLHMIPIYRAHEAPQETHKNKDSFKFCIQHFEKGGVILIFPEGISLTERKIKKIQSGAARICFGAEAQNNFNLNLKIVSIGLNFSNPHKFQSVLFVKIEKPIVIKDYETLYREDSFKAARKLTEDIRVNLEKAVVHIEDEAVDKLVASIELIYKAKLFADNGYPHQQTNWDFNTSKMISDCVHDYLQSDSERVQSVQNKINTYLDDLERLKLKDENIRHVEQQNVWTKTLTSFLYTIFGFPVFLYGFLHHYIPFRIPNIIGKKMSSRAEFYGSLALSLGTFMFLIFYSVYFYIFYLIFENWMMSIIYLVTLPVTGLFSFYYYQRLTNIKKSWDILSMFYRKTNLITGLIQQRSEIISELEQAKEMYFKKINFKRSV
ncbi:MAG: 1-acyl-sn-glycerol-3-phosphate acyltransferase [Sphingobacteriaceae bacterium]|nr:1-acyl-sn-glycerol-3-phosphate acyltransferase [Sphingobacteriaceae bacterium]